MCLCVSLKICCSVDLLRWRVVFVYKFEHTLNHYLYDVILLPYSLSSIMYTCHGLPQPFIKSMNLLYWMHSSGFIITVPCVHLLSVHNYIVSRACVRGITKQLFHRHRTVEGKWHSLASPPANSSSLIGRSCLTCIVLLLFYCIVLCCIVLHGIVLYCIVLYCTALYCILYVHAAKGMVWTNY